MSMSKKPYSQHWSNSGRNIHHGTDGIRNDKLKAIDDKLDSFSGHVNNSASIGDGSTQLRAMAMGYDRINGKARSVLVDSDGKLECNNDDLESGVNGTLTNTTLIASRTLLVKDELVDANLKLDTIDTVLDNILVKESSIDTRLDNYAGAVNNSTSIGDGSTQFRSLLLSYDRANGKARSANCDINGRININMNLGSQTTSTVADILELLVFNAQQSTQELTIATLSLGTTTTYNLQKFNKVSVIIKEELNTPAAGTAYAILEWSDNDDVFYSEWRQAFTERFRADNATSLGIWCNFDAVSVIAKYMRISIYNSDGDTHRYDVDVNFIH